MKRKALAVVTLLIAALFVGVAPANATMASNCAVGAYTPYKISARVIAGAGSATCTIYNPNSIRVAQVTAGHQRWTGSRWVDMYNWTNSSQAPSSYMTVTALLLTCTSGTYRTASYALDTAGSYSSGYVVSLSKALSC